MKVLVVEDDPTDLKLVGAVLRISGHSVSEKIAAESAMEAIAAESPDIVLLDMQLPGMDGLTLIRQLKANEITRQIPIVAVTAYPDRYTREAMLAAGCAACIVKPIDTRVLASQLTEAIAKNQ